jgi:hypothetical protein
MLRRMNSVACMSTLLILAWPMISWGQSFNSSLSGTVTDPSGAVVPNVELTLTSVETKAVTRVTTGPDGLYAFNNLGAGDYELRATAKGFREFVRTGIELNINTRARVDISLLIGAESQTVEVRADVSQLNFEDPSIRQAVTPQVIGELPLIVGGAIRSSAAFVTLMPGVNTGASQNPYSVRINGGLTSGDEAVLDGVSLTQGINGNTGMISAYADYPWSPEAISEVSVLTSNYEPQYGATTSGVIMAETKSGTNQYHGAVYEFLRNTALNARQFGTPDRTKDIENDFGANIGGPIKIPWIFDSGRKKSYFFVNYEGFKIRGGASTPVLSIPSMRQRNGDFTDWVDEEGNLIPIYDPRTTTLNPNFDPNQPSGPNNLQFLRQQFMGCDGNTPNVICMSGPNRYVDPNTGFDIADSLAHQWIRFLPTPTFSGPLNNYVVPEPIPDTVFADSVLFNVRGDMYWRDIDHFYVTVNYRGSTASSVTQLPPQLAFEGPYFINYSFVDRFNWTHTFRPNLINHFAVGYLDTVAEVTSSDKDYVNDLPQIPGASNYEFPPQLYFDDFTGWGRNGKERGTRPVWIANDLVTWVKGKHTLKFGGEIRKHAVNGTAVSNESGTVSFSRVGTGLNETNSGNAFASFLLEQVSYGEYNIQTVDGSYPRFSGYNFHVGDTIKLTPKFTLTLGMRWDMYKPTIEKFDNLSFFDPLGPNPAAANRPGRLAFAGTKWGAASFGRRYPEELYKRAFAPRLGIAYAVNKDTVVRSGYGIFFSTPIYPGWGGGIAQDGFNATLGFPSSNFGYNPAFLLSDGFPAIDPSRIPPYIDSSFSNGADVGVYRPFDANRLPYAQQWNLTIEHQATPNLAISASYIANKGTRLPSRQAALNALNPSYLSMGNALGDEFEPGMTELDGVPIPYDGWIEQMNNCTPTVAQALLPYPQYCSSLQGLNENAGNSTYHSFQLKVEKRMSHGIYLLNSYTISKMLTDSEGVQIDAATWSAAHGVVSPYERRRNKGLALNDVPQALTTTLVYELPLGAGKRWANQGGAANALLGGWQVSTIFRLTSGVPMFFRSFNCNVPGEFRASCIPALLPGANPWAQDKSDFDPSQPLLNRSAFEPADSFNFYWGEGPRISDLRGFGYRNQDLTLMKNTRFGERFNLQFRVEFFNVWNWHTFTSPGGESGLEEGFQVFDIDVSSPAFGMWNGRVSTPRNIQFGLKFQF